MYSKQSVDWKKEGPVFGASTSLKKLEIRAGDDEHEGVEQLCRALALNNRCIEHLSLRQCDTNLAFLPQFLERNHNLRCLIICTSTIDSHNKQLLLTALSLRRDESSLEHVGFCFCDAADKDVGDLVSSLSGHRNIVKLSLEYNKVARKGCMELAALIQSPNSALREVNLTSNNLDDKCITLLTNALSHNNTLSTLSLGGNRSVTFAGWQHFIRWLQTSNASVEKIDLDNNRLSDELVGALANNIFDLWLRL